MIVVTFGASPTTGRRLKQVTFDTSGLAARCKKTSEPTKPVAPVKTPNIFDAADPFHIALGASGGYATNVPRRPRTASAS